MSPLPGWRLVWSLYGRFWCRSSLEVLSGARARGHVVKGHVARSAQPPIDTARWIDRVAPFGHLTKCSRVKAVARLETGQVAVQGHGTDKGMDAGTDRGTDTARDSTEGGAWLTYGELAKIRDIDRHSAVKLVTRHRWRRQKDNRGILRILVPPEWAASRDKGTDKGTDPGTDRGTDIPTLQAAITSLQGAFDAAMKAKSCHEGQE
jgi:hypothetical protein